MIWILPRIILCTCNSQDNKVTYTHTLTHTHCDGMTKKDFETFCFGNNTVPPKILMKTVAADSGLSQTLCRNVLSQCAERPSSVCGPEIKDELAGRKKGKKARSYKRSSCIRALYIPACRCRRLQQKRPMPIFARFR